MWNKFLVTVVVLGSILSAMVIVTLAGCGQQAGPALQADPPVKRLPEAAITSVMCLDGWEAMVVGDAVVYRHEHDVQEHLISCRGDSNG